MNKLFVSMTEYMAKGSVTVSIVLFTLKPDHRGKYNLGSHVNYDIRQELEKYSYFSMSPDTIEDYKELMRNEKKVKYAQRIKSYIPQHIQKTIDRLDNKKNFVYYQQFHLCTPS